MQPSEFTLVLKKNRSEIAQDWVSFVVGVVIFPGLLVAMLFLGEFPDDPGFTFYFVSIAFAAWMFGIVATQLIELSINNRDFTIEKKASSIMVNSKTVEASEATAVVVIRGQKAWDGIGESFFVGIEGERSYPFVFYQTKEGAEYIASALSEFLNLKVVHKPSRFISFLKWH